MITKQQLKWMGAIQDIRNATDSFNEIPYEHRIMNRYYNELVIKADILAQKLSTAKS